MSTVIEKITLYDFFGYLIPGITFETLLCIAYLISLGGEAAMRTVTQMSGIGGSLYIFFFLMGYVLGLFLSEIAARFYGMKWMRKKLCSSKGLRELETNLSVAVVRNALVNSGLVEASWEKEEENKQKTAEEKPGDSSESAGVAKLLENYSRLMYSDIQTDPNYKRIHEYYSFATMCKNLSAAFALAAVMSLFIMTGCGTWRIALAVVGQLLAACLFFVRYQRFYMKKQAYTVYWFVGKNRNRTETVGTAKNRLKGADDGTKNN